MLYGSDTETTDIMLQGFKWDAIVEGKRGGWYDHLAGLVDSWAEVGISLIWLPPPSKEREQNHVGYTPMDLYDLGQYRQWIQYWDNDKKEQVWYHHQSEETLYGTKQQLLDLIRKIKDSGLKPIADIVINHRVAQQFNSQGELLSWGGDEHTIASGKLAWGYNDPDPPEVVRASGGGLTRDDGEGGFAPNVAHQNPVVRRELKEWLHWLKEEIGFEGWRYDFVKGYQPQHLGEYNYHTQPYISVGEYFDNNAQLIYNWIDGTDAYHAEKRSMAFDFPLQDHLKKVFWGDRPYHTLGTWKYANIAVVGGWPAKAVTFLDNHDTYEKPYRYFPTDAKRLIQGHVFLLTHPGIPCIYWSHLYEHDASVREMIFELCQLRREQGITNQAYTEVLKSENGLYVAKIAGRVIVQIGDNFWSPFGEPGQWELTLNGDGYAIWVNKV